MYGRTDITSTAVISTVKFAKTNWGNQGDKSCEQIWRDNGYEKSDQIICVGNETSASIIAGQGQPVEPSVSLNGKFWSAYEWNASHALDRHFYNDRSYTLNTLRGYADYYALCLGD